MIIKKIDPVHGGVFPGAAYNEKKVLAGVAELAGHANIDGNFLHTLHTLHTVGIDCSKEVERYLQSRSQAYGNTRSTQWQGAPRPFLQRTGEEQSAACRHRTCRDARVWHGQATRVSS